MDLKSNLKKLLKILGGDTRSAIVSLVVTGILTYSGFLIFSKTVLNYSVIFLTTPTPLWVALLFPLLSYIFLRIRLSHSSNTQTRKSRIVYFAVGNLKWKTEIYQNGAFRVIGVPYCDKHEYSLIHSGLNWICPEAMNRNCDVKIFEGNLSSIRVHANSYIEKAVRDNYGGD